MNFELKIESYWDEDSPLKLLHDWTRKRNADDALLCLLSENFFTWNNPNTTLCIVFRPADANYIYYKDGISANLCIGDVLFVFSHVNRSSGYRKDILRLYEWVEDSRGWALKNRRVQYFAKTGLLGKFIKPMDEAWGVSKEPRKMLPSF